MALLFSPTPKCRSSRTGSIRVRRTSRRLPVLFAALAFLTFPAAGAVDPSPLSRHLVRCSQEPPPSEAAPDENPLPTVEPPTESRRGAPSPGPPAQGTTAPDEAGVFGPACRLFPGPLLQPCRPPGP